MQLSAVTRAIVFGTTVTALMQGLLLGIGFAIAGLPSPVVFGVLVALVSMLPVGGAAFVWVPAVGWLFYEGRWGFAIFMLAWGLMLGGLDNVLRPLLISGRARISGSRSSSACSGASRPSAPSASSPARCCSRWRWH